MAAFYDAPVGQPPAAPADCPVVVSRDNCDRSQRPIVFVHGTYSSGTDIEHMVALLGSNGFCQDQIVAIDYDSVSLSAGFSGGGVDSPGLDCTGPNTPSGCGMIDNAVNDLLRRFPQFTQVDLMGHSQGTFHCGDYLAAHPDKIAHYINFSGIPHVGNIPTLSLSSQRDLFGFPHHATGNSNCALQQLEDGGSEMVMPTDAGPGADAGPQQGVDAGGTTNGGCNVHQYTFIHQDHFAVAASKDSFVQVYRFLTGKEPKYTDIQCGDDPVLVEGIAEHFADNAPMAGTVEIREVTSTPQDTTTPVTMFTNDIGADGGADGGTTPPGHFGPVMLHRNVPYVFTGKDAMGNVVGWQYFTPFQRDNRLVRLLSPAGDSSDKSPFASQVMAMSTGKVKSDPSSTVIVARWAQGGFRQDLGAHLYVNGVDVLTSENSGLAAAKNMSLQGGVAALFLEDANLNQKTDFGLADFATFIAFTDVYVSAAKPGFVDMVFTAGSEDPATVHMPIAIENYPLQPTAGAGTQPNRLVAVMFQ